MKDVIKGSLIKVLPPGSFLALRKQYRRITSRFYSNDLNKLATIHETDKWNHHWYTQHYQRHFEYLRKKRLNILEIGVGGYENPLEGGGSLRAWKYFFPNSVIYGIDIYDKRALQEDRITIFQGSQTDESFLLEVFKQIGSVDIIIDDGSHINDHVITTFKILFPLLNNGGIYVVEDTEKSYDPCFGGDNENLHNPKTMMNFFKNLGDCLNYEEIQFYKSEYEPSYFDKNIVSAHFYHNLVFIYKGVNKSSKEFNPIPVMGGTASHR